MPMETAFDFYSIMSELQQRLLEGALFGPEEIIQEIFAGPEFDLRGLRLKHCNGPHDLRPALKTFRSLHTPNGGTDGFGRRRKTSGKLQLERRSSSVGEKREKQSINQSINQLEGLVHQLIHFLLNQRIKLYSVC